MTPHDLAPAMYAGYAEDRDWTTDRGDRMPLWDGLTFGERSHWLAAADAVLDRLTQEGPSDSMERLGAKMSILRTMSSKIERGDHASSSEPRVASLRFDISYLLPEPGQWTSKVAIRTVAVPAARDTVSTEHVRVWADPPGEAPGKELERCVLGHIAKSVHAWAPEAERLQGEAARAGGAGRGQK